MKLESRQPMSPMRWVIMLLLSSAIAVTAVGCAKKGGGGSSTSSRRTYPPGYYPPGGVGAGGSGQLALALGTNYSMAGPRFELGLQLMANGGTAQPGRAVDPLTYQGTVVAKGHLAVFRQDFCYGVRPGNYTITTVRPGTWAGNATFGALEVAARQGGVEILLRVGASTAAVLQAKNQVSSTRQQFSYALVQVPNAWGQGGVQAFVNGQPCGEFAVEGQL